MSGSSPSTSTIILSQSIMTLLPLEQGDVEGFIMQTRVPSNSYT
jgi:hypothetical protein